MLSLETIARIEIPLAVRDHRFYIEAEANGRMLEIKGDPTHQVVGTYNTRRCELYGWTPNVTPHRDCIGWMYGVLLDDGPSYVHARPRRIARTGPHLSVRLQEGDVFRLDDFCEHWTEDAKPRVAAFVGCFDEPCDEEAIATLRDGIASLERGDYYGAPRVRDGFRAVLDDEAYVANEEWTDSELMLLADVPAARRGAILQCASCDRPAVRLDDHWPYYHDHNRCRRHLLGAQPASKPELSLIQGIPA